MATTLIIGATRGIGLELVRQYAAAGDNVIACARDLNAAGGLPELAATADNISVEQLDIADPASIKAAKANIGAQPIDVVLVVAGITGGDHQSLDDIDIEAWHHALNANTVGPMLVAAQFKENLVAAGDGHLMIVSSQLAASTWPMGGRYIYATTKAAVNRVGQLLAIDWRDDPITLEAQDFLRDLLMQNDPMATDIKLSSGQGILNNNVLHNRTAFETEDKEKPKRQILRVRFLNRIGSIEA